MASSVNSVWAIDIGSNALKALRFTKGEDGLEVIGFDYIEHSSILSSEDVDPGEREDIISQTMQIFASRNDVDSDQIAISVAGHNSFARFIKLPPVEEKRIPEIVKFEAVQQIPFDINDVEWDWQLMDNPDSDEIEVGLFAIKNELIANMMDHFAEEGMQVGYVQIAPIALHNYVTYDRSDVGSSKEKATVILDMGAENTTLVVCTKNTVWQRSIRIGGNTFTEAIQDKFDISFTKAEKHKRAALRSKYVRQIFSAMKPIYTDLGSEVQRSLGFYASSGPGRDKGFSRIIALGGGMKLKGVTKYLQQTLGIPVERPDSLNKVKLGGGLSGAKFHENISDFMTAYGLGVQALDDDPAIKSNLLPRKIVRAMEWARKARVLTVAAIVFLVVAVLGLGRGVLDNAKYSSHESDRKKVSRVISQAQQVDGDYSTQTAREEELNASVEKVMSYFSYRDVVPELAQSIYACLPSKDNSSDEKQIKVYEAFASGDVEGVMSIDREERKQLFITAMTIDYAPKISMGAFRGINFSREPSRRRRSRGGDSGGGDAGGMGMGMGMGMDMGMMGMGMGMGMPGGEMGGFGGMGGMGGMGGDGMGGESGEEGVVDEKDGPGFVVTIEGYSPYKDIGDLLDPPSVGKDRDKWGVITRFEHINKIIKDCPFELYVKNNTRHFKQVSGEVEHGNNEMPGGFGEVKFIQRVAPPEETSGRGVSGSNRSDARGSRSNTRDKVSTETVLVDPMTREEMSKTYDFITQNEVDSDPSKDADDLGKIKIDYNGEQEFIVRDHWFRINVKFLWTESPDAQQDDAEAGEEDGFGGGGGYSRR